MTTNNIIGALRPGTKLQNGKYTIRKALGQGATGITYMADVEQRLDGNLSTLTTKVQVAIKEFFFKEECQRESTTCNVLIANTNLTDRVGQFKHSFIKEAKRIAGLSHPNIVHVLSIFEENGTVYYVMQYIRGGSIKDRIDREGTLPEAQAVKYARQVASALEYMHGKRMCHYDLKPGNIMLSEDDDAMLIDFGISKNYDDNGQQTSTTPPGLTKGFAPLEQYTAVSEFSPLIDVYSLGATLYAMLTGTTPPEPMKWISEPFTPKPDGVSEQVWSIVSQAMSVRTQDRPDMTTLHYMLEGVTNESQSAVGGGEETVYVSEMDDQPGSAETVYEANPFERQHDAPKPATASAASAQNGGGSQPPQDTDTGSSLEDAEEESFVKKYWLYIVAFLVVAGLAYMIGSGMFSGGAKADTDSIAVNDSAKVDAATTLSDASGNPVTFDGESVAGRPNGHGVMTYLNSSVLLRYEGELKSGSREDDAAVLYYKNGDKYSGSFKNDHFATGTYFVKESGERFQGTFKNDQPWNGVWYDSDDSVVGQIIDGEDAGI